PQAPEDQKDGADVAFPGHGAGSLAALHDGFGNEKGHRYHVGEQCATGQGDHAGGVLRCHPGTADVNRIAPHHGRRQQLQVGHQAGGQVDGADLGAVPQLEDGGDQADDDGGEQLVDIVVGGIVDIPGEEAEVQGGGEDDKKSEDHFFQVHGVAPRFVVVDCVGPGG